MMKGWARPRLPNHRPRRVVGMRCAVVVADSVDDLHGEVRLPLHLDPAGKGKITEGSLDVGRCG